MILTVECILLCIALEWTLPVPYPLLASLDKLCMELHLVHWVWVRLHGPMVLMEEIYKMLPHWTTFWSGRIQWGFRLSFCLLPPGWPALLQFLEWWCAACNSHYNRTPDLGSLWCGEVSGLSVGVVNTRREGTRLVMSLGLSSTRTLWCTSTRREGTWLPL